MGERETVEDASGKDQLSVLKPWSGYEVRRLELFKCNSSTLNNPGLTYKTLIPFMKTPYFFFTGRTKLIRIS